MTKLTTAHGKKFGVSWTQVVLTHDNKEKLNRISLQQQKTIRTLTTEILEEYLDQFENTSIQKDFKFYTKKTFELEKLVKTKEESK